MNNTRIIGGYHEDVITEDQYLSGTLKKEVLQKNRDWRPFLPSFEHQKLFGVETSNCTAFGTLKAEGAYFKRKYGISLNGSDRYLGCRAGTNGGGNSPHKVVEAQRNFAGIIPESSFGFTKDIDSADKYYRGVLFSHKLEGIKWLMKWDIQHEWVLNNEESGWQDKLFDALLFSPVGIAVDAWFEDGGKYYRKRNTDNHWTSLVHAVKNKHWLVYDSYEEKLKKLDWDYKFTRAKQYSIIPRKDFSPKFYSRMITGLIT